MLFKFIFIEIKKKGHIIFVVLVYLHLEAGIFFLHSQGHFQWNFGDFFPTYEKKSQSSKKKNFFF